MRLSVVGIGHVGLVHAACMASVGHEVLGVDEDAAKVQAISEGRLPFFEPGLAELVQAELTSGRLRVSTEVADAVRDRDIAFVCVGTPTKPNGEPDLSQVERVAATLASAIEGYVVIAEKSTVPVGTGEAVRRGVESMAPAGAEFDVASNPEFLQEGTAVRDTLEPSRIVIGAATDRATETLRRAYEPIIEATGCPVITTTVETAELVKHSSNAFLATKISFINQVAEICERTNADVETIAYAMGLDHRIGPAFLKAGIGYGGACLPKDVQAYHYTAETYGVEFPLLRAVDRINNERRLRFVERVRGAVGDLEDKRLAVWGLAFKAGTDDLRHSPGLEIAQRLSTSGAFVKAYDPAAMDAAAPLLPHVEMAADAYEAARSADAVVICTEWPAFAEADLKLLRSVMARPVIVDGRNLFDPASVAAEGFLYVSMGRPTVSGTAPGSEPEASA